ncbi:MAG: RICIN domain-containing protein [Armatimonadota bacterium]
MCLWMTSMLAACFTGISTDLHAATITNGNEQGSTDVGIWYCTYYGKDWTRVGGMGYQATLYRPLCSNKPGDYRTYDATDTAVIDFHLQQIANAKIDFILFELTPGGLGGYRPSMNAFVDNARVVAQRLKVWNGSHAWKLKYAIAAGSHLDVYGGDPIGLCMEKEAEDVYKSFYDNPDYGGSRNYYHLNGKPLIVYWGDIDGNTSAWRSYNGDKTYGDKFSIRYANEVRNGSYGWNIYNSGTVINSEVEVVSPGWGHYGRGIPPYVSRHLGDFYQNCWYTVFNNPKPKIVMIVAFNDYLENTGVWTADTKNLTDADIWYGHDEELHPWMYWDMTVGNINTLRGTPSGKIVNSSTGKVLDALDRHNGEKPYIWDDVNAASQQWQIADIGSGLCKIVNNYTGQVLDAGQYAKGKNLYMYTDTGAASQQWKIVDLEDGLSKIVNTSTGQVLDSRKKTKGSAPYMSDDAGAASQKWQINRPWATVNDNDPSISYGAGWSYNDSVSGFINNDCHTSNTPGSYIQYEFKGTVIKVIGDMDINHGMTDIYIDDRLVATIDSYSPTWKKQQKLYVNTGLSNDTHTIKVVISGDKNPNSIDYCQSIDAFGLI